MTVQELINMGYGGYAGWDDRGAEADYKATGGAGKKTGGGGSSGGYTSPQDYASALIDAQKKQINEETSFLDQYTKTNPFIFDEVLARESSTAEYHPYYSEMLQDYLSSVNLKRQSLTEQSKYMKTLRDMDANRRTREYQLAVETAQKGFAGKNMFFSGIRQRGEGLLGVDYSTGERQAQESYGYEKGIVGRETEALDIAEKQQKRDVGREEQASIEGGILQRKKESMTNYYAPLEMSYYRKFPTASGSTLKGYTLPDYYRA